MKTAEDVDAPAKPSSVGAILQGVMTEECKLRTTTRHCYRNLRGPYRHSLQKLFDDQCRQLESWLDQLKTRGHALAPQGAATAEFTTDEPRVESGTVLSGMPAAGWVGALITWHEQLATRLQADTHYCAKALADQATAETLDQLARFHETTAWLLRTALEWRDSGI
ncbi:MAG: hypothetical protein RIQ93_907 [Verrucomicrobiota bacterium]|jgi:DNA-binding ferritin-like protein